MSVRLDAPLVAGVAMSHSNTDYNDKVAEQPTHVDRVFNEPLSVAPGRLQARYRSIDDPRIGAQERSGWAAYVYVSDPHTMAECPFGPGYVLEPE